MSAPWQPALTLIPLRPNIPALHALLDLACQRLEARSKQDAQLLRQRFQEGKPRDQVACELKVSVFTLDKYQRRAVEALAHILEELVAEAQKRQENEADATGRQMLLARVNRVAEPTRLFGVQRHLAQLRAWLEDPTGPRVVIVHGIGGIGKTSLAADYVRQALAEQRFPRMAWTTARTEDFLLDGTRRARPQASVHLDALLADLVEQLVPIAERPLPFTLEAGRWALARVLAQTPHLIVIDNLETVSQVDELLHLLSTFRNTPARFLLTSRHLPAAGTLFARLPLFQLSFPDTRALLHHLATQTGVDALLDPPLQLEEAIYMVVGGNPLALRLFVGQCRFHPPTEVLAAMKRIQGRAVEELYAFIYQRAWSLLSPDERALLLAMIAVPPEGASVDYIATLSNFLPTQVRDILDRLVSLSLVDVRFHVSGQAIYTIHSLTRTFLRTQVLDWPTLTLDSGLQASEVD